MSVNKEKSMNRKITISIVLIIVMAVSYYFFSDGAIKANITIEDIDGITLELVGESIMEAGIVYNLNLSNDSSKVLVFNNVFISYPIKGENNNSQHQNEFKVEARNNVLNLKSGESVRLTAFMPKEVYSDNERILQNEPWFEIMGYLGKVDEANRFMSGGDLK